MTDKPTPNPNAIATNGTVHGEVLGFAKRVIGVNAVGFLLVIILTAGVVLWGRQVLAQDGGEAASVVLAPVRADVELLKAAQLVNAEVHARQERRAEEQERRQLNMERITVEMSLNVQIMMREQGLRPVRLVPTDGGTP